MRVNAAAVEEVAGRLEIDRATLHSLCNEANEWPLPGHGSTARRFQLLGTVAAADLVMGRLVEAHADAVAIASELGGERVQAGQCWGVWAAGPPDSLQAATIAAGCWEVSGVKPWCSGATLLTHTLVDASTDRGQQMFAVDLTAPGVSACPPSWVGPGMARADTRSVSFERAAAIPVGGPGDYLQRPGFWMGAMGVAACWHGGTVAVGRFLLDRARHSNDPHLMAHLGAVHASLGENRAVLDASAQSVDRTPGSDHALLARSVRATVERNAADVVDRVGRALGPAPMAHDPHHSALVVDLMVYVRQHHAERDLEQIGREAAARTDPWPFC